MSKSIHKQHMNGSDSLCHSKQQTPFTPIHMENSHQAANIWLFVETMHILAVWVYVNMRMYFKK